LVTVFLVYLNFYFLLIFLPLTLLDPDPHWDKMLDPDPHIMNAYPHWGPDPGTQLIADPDPKHWGFVVFNMSVAVLYSSVCLLFLNICLLHFLSIYIFF
jgi:hypothetical protein